MSSKVKTIDLTIIQGATFQQIVRWEGKPIVWKPITGLSNTAPVSIVAIGHGMVDGWRCVIESVKGPNEINCENNPPRESDWHEATVIDVDTIELNAGHGGVPGGWARDMGVGGQGDMHLLSEHDEHR